MTQVHVSNNHKKTEILEETPKNVNAESISIFWGYNNHDSEYYFLKNSMHPLLLDEYRCFE